MSVTNIHNDKQLLQLVAQGDGPAFAELMERYHAPAFRVVMKLLQDRWAAEDVVQDIFLKVWLSRETLPEVENFHGWLLTLATHKVYDQVRRYQRESAHLQRWQKELNITADTAMSAGRPVSDFEELVTQAMARLSPKQQRVFTYIKKEGYSRQETAAIMNISPETVKTHLEQAMRTIRAYCLSRMDTRMVTVLIALIVRERL